MIFNNIRFDGLNIFIEEGKEKKKITEFDLDDIEKEINELTTVENVNEEDLDDDILEDLNDQLNKFEFENDSEEESNVSNTETDLENDEFYNKAEKEADELLAEPEEENFVKDSNEELGDVPSFDSGDNNQTPADEELGDVPSFDATSTESPEEEIGAEIPNEDDDLLEDDDDDDLLEDDLLDDSLDDIDFSQYGYSEPDENDDDDEEDNEDDFSNFSPDDFDPNDPSLASPDSETPVENVENTNTGDLDFGSGITSNSFVDPELDSDNDGEIEDNEEEVETEVQRLNKEKYELFLEIKKILDLIIRFKSKLNILDLSDNEDDMNEIIVKAKRSILTLGENIKFLYNKFDYLEPDEIESVIKAAKIQLILIVKTVHAELQNFNN